MAETESRKVIEDSKAGLPSNEEVIDSLVKGMGDSLVRDDVAPDEPTIINKISELNIDGDSKPNENISNQNETSEECEFDQEESENINTDDFIDEEHLKDLEVDYSEEDKMRLKGEAEKLKNEGNNHFKGGEFKEAALTYTKALRICPLAFSKNRSVLYSNRAAAKIKLFLSDSAIEDCTKAVELDPQYVKAYVRRAQLYEETDKLDEALADYKKILEVDPLHRDALFASKRLAEQINERNEKLKTEMLGKLKDLGNMFLKPFGLSTNNFQMVQDPNTGGYSINFSQNPNHS